MATPSDADVKGAVREKLLLIIRDVQIVQAAVERAEAAFSGPDFTTITTALDEVSDQVSVAREATD